MTFEENVMTTESTRPRTPDPVPPSPLRWPSQRGGPYPHLRLDLSVKAGQGLEVMRLVLGEHYTFRQAAAALGMSLTTAWRRYWFVLDEPGLLARVPLLRGSVLACWCAPEPCHADVLARLADADRAEYPALLEEFAASSGTTERDAAADAWLRRTSGK